MYPAGDLRQLAERKRELCERAVRDRAQLAAHAANLARPVVLADRAIDLWRRMSPWIKYVALPAGVFARRPVVRQLQRVPRFLRWAPVALRAIRIFRDVVAALPAMQRPRESGAPSPTR